MQTIYLDISNKGVIPCIQAKQTDVGRKFLAIITDCGLPYNIPDDAFLSVWYDGESGSGNYTDIGERAAFSKDGNKLTIELIENMLVCPGNGVFTVLINSVNGDQIGLWNIDYFVEAIPGMRGKSAEDYYTAFSKTVNELSDAAKTFTVDATLSKKGNPADAYETGKKVAEVNARVTNLATLKEGSTTGDAELMDVRVGADGKTYDSAGDAVRGQMQNIHGILKTEKVGKNLLNLATVTPNKNFDSAGNIIDSSNYSMSDYIPVTPGQVLSFQFLFNGLPVIGTMRWIVAYDVGGNILDIQQNIATYTVVESATAIRFTASNDRISADFQPMFIEGTEVIEYEEYYDGYVLGCEVKAENVVGLESVCNEIVEEAVEEALAGMGDTEKAYYFRNVDSVCDRYSNESAKVEFTNHDSVDVIYSMYDALVDAYPDYVTKTLLGTIATDNLPIYRYDFTPKLPIDSHMERLFKVLYCSGTHGGENAPIWVGVRFFKDLCENWRTQDLLRTLHFNCQFTVIPIVNPYGFVHATRQNENQVDLNRNFTNGWHNNNNLVVGDTNYPGASPASEISTQLIEAMIANEPFDFGIDHHTYGAYTASGKAGYFVTSNLRPEDVSFADMLGVWMNGKTMSNNTLINDFSTSHFQTISGAGFGGYLYGAIPNGFCFENMHIWGSNEMEAVYESQKFNAETIGAIFHSAFVGYHTY